MEAVETPDVEAETPTVEAETVISSSIYTDNGVFNPSHPKRLDDYYIYENFLTNEEIDRIHELVKHLPVKDGTISTQEKGTHVKESYRRSKIRWIPKTEEFKWLYDRILYYTRIANNDMWNFQIFGMGENLQYGEYSSEYKGKYEGHLDIGSGKQSMRKISVSIQLTDCADYKDGDLLLNVGSSPIYAPRRKGTMILFPSYFHHKVTEVTEGTRHSLVTWITGPAWM